MIVRRKVDRIVSWRLPCSLSLLLSSLVSSMNGLFLMKTCRLTLIIIGTEFYIHTGACYFLIWPHNIVLLSFLPFPTSTLPLIAFERLVLASAL